jgi:hypothetical protein
LIGRKDLSGGYTLFVFAIILGKIHFFHNPFDLNKGFLLLLLWNFNDLIKFSDITLGCDAVDLDILSHLIDVLLIFNFVVIPSYE